MDGGTLEIGSNTALGNGVSVNCMDSIVIGEGVQIGPDTKITTTTMTTASPAASGREIRHRAGDDRRQQLDRLQCGHPPGNEHRQNCIVGAGSVLKGAYPAGSVIVQKRQTTVTVYPTGTEK